jgi:hypothetical protein
MGKIIALSRTIIIALWCIITLFVILALVDKSFNPGFKSISQLDLRNYLKFSLIILLVLSILLLLKKCFIKK